MKITCSSCNTRYSIPDEKVQGEGRTFKIRCKSCGEMILVQGVAEGGAGAASEGGDPEWYYAVGSDRKGPVTREDLAGLIESGEITADTYVWKTGMGDWTHLAEVEELADLAADQTAYMSQDQIAAAHAHLDAPAAAPAAAVAAAPDPFGGGVAAASDPFAGADTGPFGSGVEPARAPAPSPMASAVSPIASSAPAPVDDPFSFDSPEPASSGPSVHGRRESSVLFSLDDLGDTGSRGMTEAEALVTETSGLIDIRAVAATQEKRDDNPFGDGPSVAGLATPGGGGGMAMTMPVASKKRGGKGPIVMLAILLVAVIGLGVGGWFVIQKMSADSEAEREKAAELAATAAAAAEAKAQAEIEKVRLEAEAAAAKAAAEAEKAKSLAVAKATEDAEEDGAEEEEDDKTDSPTRKRRRKSTRSTSSKSDDDDPPAAKKSDSPKKKSDAASLLLGAGKPKAEKSSGGGGKLSKSQIQSTISGAGGRFSSCGRMWPGKPAGASVTASLTIKSSGSVSRASVSGSAPMTVKSCVKRALLGVKFPSAGGDTKGKAKISL